MFKIQIPQMSCYGCLKDDCKNRSFGKNKICIGYKKIKKVSIKKENEYEEELVIPTIDIQQIELLEEDIKKSLKKMNNLSKKK